MRRTKQMLFSVACVWGWVMFPASADNAMHGRVSFDAGGTMVRGSEDSDWSHATVNTIVMSGDTLWTDEGGSTELELAGGSFVRMADSSKMEVYSLPPSAELRGWTGSFYLQRTSRSNGDLLLQTPSAAVRLDRDSAARVDVVGEGSTTVSVRWGTATVQSGNSAPQRISGRQRVYVDPGMLPSIPIPFDATVEDDFDGWNRDRAQVLATGLTNAPTVISADADTLGVADLATYGDWVDYDNRQYWRPRETNFVPYRDGCWSYVPTVGYCWNGSYPFAYVTSHYGRWTYADNYGWLWAYDRQWSPAWVATVRCGDNLMWTPVGFDNRPVYVRSSTTFNIGGIPFSFAATSYIPQDRIYYGPSYVAPVRPAVIQNVNVTNINIWNINVNNRAPYVNVPYKDARLTVFNNAPRQIMRGPQQYGKRAENARDVAQRLERKNGARSIDMANARKEAPTAQTAAEPKDRQQKIRQIRLEPEQKQAIRNAPAEGRDRKRNSDKNKGDEKNARTPADNNAPPEVQPDDSNRDAMRERKGQKQRDKQDNAKQVTPQDGDQNTIAPGEPTTTKPNPDAKDKKRQRDTESVDKPNRRENAPDNDAQPKVTKERTVNEDKVKQTTAPDRGERNANRRSTGATEHRKNIQQAPQPKNNPPVVRQNQNADDSSVRSAQRERINQPKRTPEVKRSQSPTRKTAPATRSNPAPEIHRQQSESNVKQQPAAPAPPAQTPPADGKRDQNDDSKRRGE